MSSERRRYHGLQRRGGGACSTVPGWLLLKCAPTLRCCRGSASPGIHARNRFFWLSEKRPGRVVCYDVASGRASVFREPPVAPVSTRRAERTLGSVNGRPRFCAVDVIQGSVQEIQGMFSVWLLDDEGFWRCVHKEDIHKEADEGTSTWMDYYLFLDMNSMDSPVDFANSSDAWLVLERMGILQKRDLTTGTRSYLRGLHAILEAGSRHQLYRFFDVFPLFM